MARIVPTLLLLANCLFFGPLVAGSPLRDGILLGAEYMKGPQPDGPLYNSARFGGQPRLDFLGSFNGIDHYINRISDTQRSARTVCHAQGMELIAPVSQAHLNWITSVTTAEDDYSWSDGRLNKHLLSYVYDQRCQNGICTPLSDDLFESEYGSEDLVGLAISRYGTSNTKFIPLPVTNLRRYICTAVV